MINASHACIPLSPYQHDIWVASMQFPDNNQYTIFSYIQFSNNIDENVLETALISATKRTDAFRLRIDDEGGIPCQWIAEDDEYSVIRIDLTRQPDSEAALETWLQNAFSHSYRLNGEKLVDFNLLRTSQYLYLHVRTHHIVSDAWGLQFFLNLVRTTYLQLKGISCTQELDVSPFFAAVENDNYLSSEQYQLDMGYFSETLAGATPALFNRKVPKGYRRTQRHSFQLERSVLTTLRERGESPFLFLSAAVALYLAQIHQADEVVIGVPVLNRADRSAKQIVGHFANTLPLRIETLSALSVGDFMSRLRNGIRALLRHQRLPLGELATQSTQWFDITLSYMRWPTPAAIPGVQDKTVAQTHAHDQDALAIWVSEFSSRHDAQIDFEYACDVFDKDFPIEAVAQHIKNILMALLNIHESDKKISDINPLSQAEFKDLIYQRNQTTIPYPDQTTLPELFAEQVIRTPNHIALIEPDGTSVTYKDLERKATNVAAALRYAGISPDDRVAVLIERGKHLLPAILGVQLAGGAYVPVDPKYPTERIKLLLEDSGAHIVLSEHVDGELMNSSAYTILQMENIPESVNERLPPVAGPTNLSYLIYTSGSTGMPKGVMIEHRSVVNRLHWMQRRFPIDERDVLLQKTPTSFDVSVWELFWWSFTGARLSLLPPGAEKDPLEVLHAIKKAGVTVIHFVPSMLSPFLDLLENDPSLRASAASLRVVFCSGEALAPAQVIRFKRIFGSNVQIVNLYGPTEASIDVSDFECSGEQYSRIPIGKPIDNIKLYVLDSALRPQPSGAAGELFIGGVGLARGYLNRPDLTQERFIPDPFIPGERLYRTGDLARWLADGTLEYLGRIDDQVKIRGNRVEPNEVRDALLMTQASIKDAAVVVGASAFRGNYLIGYYISDEPIDVGTLRTGLAEHIPEYMIPAFFVRVNAFALTANGKLDRKALPLPEINQAGVSPRTKNEEILAAVWADVLGIQAPGIHDDFFTSGGDSILMLRVRAGVQKKGLSFELADLLRNPTISGLAEHVIVAAAEQRIEPFSMVAQVDKPGLSHFEDAFPVSRLSLGLLFHTSQHSHSSVYRDVFRYRFGLAWDEAAFRRAIASVVARFPALRSSFDLVSCSEPLQRIHHTVDNVLQIVDLRGQNDPDKVIESHIQQRRFHNYKMDTPPLYLFAAFIGESELNLVFSFHHAILDGWSVGYVITALIASYHGENKDYDAPSLAHYVQEERNSLASPAAARYWRERLKGTTATRIDGFSTHEPSNDGVIMSPLVALPANMLTRIKNLAAEHAMPLKSLLLAAHCLTLHLFSQANTVVTGVVTHGRPDLNNADRMVGLFLNTLPVRSEINERTWIEVATELFRQELEGHLYRRYPLSAIQEAYGDTLHTAFNFVNLHVLEPLKDLKEMQVWEETNFSLFINVISTPIDEGMYIRVDSDGKAITQEQTRHIGNTFIAILQRMASQPDEAVNFAFLAPRSEITPRQQSLVDVVTLFELQSKANPKNPAVSCDEVVWDYAYLDKVAQYIATHLANTGAAKGDVIGVALNRSPEMIATVWGILRAGLVCVPLDVSYPANRLKLILEVAKPYRVIVHAEHAHIAPAKMIISVHDMMAPVEPIIFPAPDLDDLALLLFTSGSTGRPKGVELPHRMWANYTHWQVNVPSGARGGSTLQFAPLSFDMAFQEIFSTLCAGGELRIVSNKERLDPAALLHLLNLRNVQRVLLPFVALQQLAEASNALGIRPQGLRVVISSGEQLRITEEIRAFCSAMPHLLLENQYGPTETHQVTYYSLTGNAGQFPALPPIGRPIGGVDIYVLDSQMQPVPAGIIGEIYAGGECLARGYRQAQALTDERFLPHPWHTGAKLYRTGDLGRLLSDGNIVWLGRADSQVKVRGFRIEPAEVELAIMRQAEKLPGLQGAAVIARKHNDTDAFLAAFLVGDQTSVDISELKNTLRNELPEFMVPSYFVWVDEFTRTPSGKRDDAALSVIPLTQEAAIDFVAPRDEYERVLVDLFTELLKIQAISINASFFDLGGTSLTAMRLMLMLEKRYGVEIPIARLIENPTVEGLAQRLRARSAILEFDPLVPVKPTGSRPPLFLVHPLGGHVLCYMELAKNLPAEQPVYALQAAGSGQGSTPLSSIEAMASEYITAIRRVQPEGPYYIGGWSLGGFVAYEMARQLTAIDANNVAQLIVLDSIAIERDRFSMASDDALLQFFYWELVWFERSVEDVEPLPENLTLDESLDHIVEKAISTGILASGTPRASVRRLFDLFRANWQALISYRPEVTTIDFTLLRATGDLPASLKPMHDAVGTLYGDSHNGWQHWTTGTLRVVDVAGDHLLLMKEPYVGAVAAAIETLLSQDKQN